MLESKFLALPRSVRIALGVLCGVALAAWLSLMGACNGISIMNSGEPAFYIGHLSGANPVWYSSGSGVPSALTIPTLPAGTSVSDLAALRFNGSADWLYLLSASGNALLVVDQDGTAFQLAATIPTGASPFALAIDGNADFAYVSNTAGGSVTVADLHSNTAVATIALPTGSQPRGIAVTPDGTKVYVADAATGSVIAIDTASRTATGTIAIGAQPERLAISPDGHELYVANMGDGTVSVIDVLSDTVSTTVTGVAATHAAAVNGTGTDLFIGQSGSGGTGSVAFYDTATVTSTAAPSATAANPVYLLGIGPGSFLSADQSAGKVSEHWVVQGSPTVDRVFTVGPSPSSLAIARDVARDPSSLPVCRLTASVTGSGTVTASPTAAGGKYSCGTQVTLTATPAGGSLFTQWSGDLTGSTNPATLTMDHDKNVIATFTTAPVVQTIVQAGSGLQIIVDGVNYSGSDTYSSPVGSSHVHSTTSPQIVAGTQYTFQNWTPSPAPNIATSLTQTVTTTSTNTTFTANFTKTGYVVSQYGCGNSIASGPAALSQNPLVYATNASLVLHGPVESYQNGAWTASAGNTNLTVSGPVALWGNCVVTPLAVCTAPPAGLAGWWGFDTAGSTAAPDLSSNHNDATIVNGAAQAAGKVGGSFNSTSAYARVPSSASLNFGTGSFSGDLWVRESDTGNHGDGWLISKYANGQGYAFALTRGQESPGLTRGMLRLTGSLEWDSSIPLLPTDGVWHLLAFSYDATKPYADRVTFYVDGAAVPGAAVNTSPANTTVDTTTTSDLVIGQVNAQEGGNFTGDLDEVELFNRVIAAADLQPLLAADRLGKCKTAGTVAQTIATSPAGLLVQTDGGAAAVAPVTLNWVPGSSHTLGAPLPQYNANADTQYSSPPQWSPAGPSIASAPAASTTYTGTFTATGYKLTVLTSPPNCATVTLNPQPTGGFLPAGQTVIVSATGTPGYAVSSIDGATNGSVTMTQPQTVTVNCSQPPTVTAAYSSKETSGANIALSFTNTGQIPATNLRINGVASATPTVVLASGAAGPIAFPMSLGTLAPGQSMSRMFLFQAASAGSSINVPFSLTVRYQADNLPEQTMTIQVPYPR
jgi:YVTN family beta-propeller protein